MTQPWQDELGCVRQELAGAIRSITVELPLALPTDGYKTTRVDLRLSAAQQSALRRLFDGLNLCDARLADGRHVELPVDAVRWLLEQVGNGEC